MGGVELYTPVDHNFKLMESEARERFEATRTSEYWEYRRRWETYPLERTVGDFPINIDIDITSRCNLKCIMCPRTELVEKGRFWGDIDFPIDLYVAIIKEGVENGLCAVKYNILGEPLLHPLLPEMIRIAKTFGVIDTLLNTNGTLLTDKYSTDIILSGLDKMFFSFDSPYKETYNKIRIGANYDKVLYKIKRFMFLRNHLDSITPFTRASMVLMEENKDEWDDFETLFYPIVDTVGQSIFLKHSGQEEDRTVKKLGKKKKFCCPQLWQRMFVHSDGEAGVCCIDTGRTIKVGNIYDASPKDIWLGSKYQEVREMHATGNFERIPACNECPMVRF